MLCFACLLVVCFLVHSRSVMVIQYCVVPDLLSYNSCVAYPHPNRASCLVPPHLMSPPVHFPILSLSRPGSGDGHGHALCAPKFQSHAALLFKQNRKESSRSYTYMPTGRKTCDERLYNREDPRGIPKKDACKMPQNPSDKIIQR